MGIILISLLVGTAVGAVSAIVFCIAFPFLGCVCSLATCGAIPIPDGVSLSAMMIFCSIAGAIIGFVYGVKKRKAIKEEKKARLEATNSELMRKQREKWASEVRRIAVNVSNTCDFNEANLASVVHSTYTAEAQMEKVLKEFSEAVELKGKIDALAEDIKKGGILQ